MNIDIQPYDKWNQIHPLPLDRSKTRSDATAVRISIDIIEAHVPDHFLNGMTRREYALTVYVGWKNYVNCATINDDERQQERDKWESYKKIFSYYRTKVEACMKKDGELTYKRRKKQPPKLTQRTVNTLSGPKAVSTLAFVYLVIKNDMRCDSCGIMHLPEFFTQDHRKCKSLGGAHDISNIDPMCSACNSSKGKSKRSDWNSPLLNYEVHEDKDMSIRNWMRYIKKYKVDIRAQAIVDDTLRGGMHASESVEIARYVIDWIDSNS